MRIYYVRHNTKEVDHIQDNTTTIIILQLHILYDNVSCHNKYNININIALCANFNINKIVMH